MITIDDDQVAAMLDYVNLADALDAAFRVGTQPPQRQQFEIETEGALAGIFC